MTRTRMLKQAMLAALVGLPLLTGTALANTSSSSSQTDSQIKTAVLKAAGVKESDVTNYWLEKETDDGQAVVEVDFTTKSTRYDYTLDTAGNILEISKEVMTPATTGQAVSQDQAKTKALKAVGLTEATVSNLRVETDREDGIDVYEISFTDKNQTTRYEYTISARTGEVIEESQDKTLK